MSPTYCGASEMKTSSNQSRRWWASRWGLLFRSSKGITSTSKIQQINTKWIVVATALPNYVRTEESGGWLGAAVQRGQVGIGCRAAWASEWALFPAPPYARDMLSASVVETQLRWGPVNSKALICLTINSCVATPRSFCVCNSLSSAHRLSHKNIR